jgi:RHS repeat-associated protein
VQKTIGSAQTSYLYDLSGNVVAEDYGTGWAPGYVYAGGQLIAEYKNGTTYFVHGNHLGSSSILTSVSGSVVDCNAFYPFGEQDISICISSNSTSHKFTGDERDTETNLDHTWFRQYTSAQGRWMTPDPAGLAAVDPTNPQSWNRYAYVFNDPLDFVDPLGLDGDCPATICVTVTRYLPALGFEDRINDAKSASNRGGCSVSIGLLTLYFTSCPFNGKDVGPRLFEKLVFLEQQAVKAACSAVPDAFTNGVGGDAGLFMTGGGQIGTIANGRTGEFSFYATGGASFGLISFDAFVAAGFVMNLPANSNLNANAYVSRAFGFYRYGGSGGSGSYQATAGPSFLPATAAKQVSATRVSPSIPLLGYALNLPRAACKLATGH